MTSLAKVIISVIQKPVAIEVRFKFRLKPHTVNVGVETYFLRPAIERHFENIQRVVSAIALTVELNGPGNAFEFHLHIVTYHDPLLKPVHKRLPAA